MQYIPDWPARLIRKVPSQLRTKPNAQGHLTGLAAGYQTVEDLSREVLTGTSLGLATGVQLDRWGALVGQQRIDLTDSEMRRFIQARVIANTSDGQPDNLIRVAQLVANAEAVWYRPDPGGTSAFFSLYMLRPDFLRETVRAEARRVLDLARPAGVEARYIEVPFGFWGLGPVSGLPESFRAYGPEGFGTGRLARTL